MKYKSEVIKGNFIYSIDSKHLISIENGYMILSDGVIIDIYPKLPKEYKGLPFLDYGDRIIIPGLCDLHIHAPQYSFRGLGMDMELLDWLETNTFPEEAKFSDLDYAQKAYEIFVENLRKSVTTRAVIFGTRHKNATILLMDLLEKSGLNTYVGKVNMDRNCPDYLKEDSAEASACETIEWINETKSKCYKNTKAILTPRFVPSCSDELMERLKLIQKEYSLPVQSHLSENPKEIEWVKSLCPYSEFYGDVYDKYGLFGKECKTIMAHCVYSDIKEVERIKENGVYIAYCPESNINLSSGVAPAKDYINRGINIGLGSDVAGGSSENMFSAIAHGIRASKLRWRLYDNNVKPLTFEEVFYMATLGGGSFFGKVGTFKAGYEFDAIVLDDKRLKYPQSLSLRERLERLVYISDERELFAKYVCGQRLF